MIFTRSLRLLAYFILSGSAYHYQPYIRRGYIWCLKYKRKPQRASLKLFMFRWNPIGIKRPVQTNNFIVLWHKNTWCAHTHLTGSTEVKHIQLLVSEPDARKLTLPCWKHDGIEKAFGDILCFTTDVSCLPYCRFGFFFHAKRGHSDPLKNKLQDMKRLFTKHIYCFRGWGWRFWNNYLSSTPIG